MDLSETLESYFRDEVNRAFDVEGVERHELTQHYLVQLLAGYASHPVESGPLAIRFMTALSESPRERKTHLREIGDTSLFVSGFWGDSLTRSLVDVDYYIELGETAYGELAGASAAGPFGSEVFARLARNFARFVEVLMTIRRRTSGAAGSHQIVRLYERWMRTRSDWAARRLAEEGVFPFGRAARTAVG